MAEPFETDTETTAKPRAAKPTKADMLRVKLREVADAITPADQGRLTALLADAIAGDRTLSGIRTITPAMAAVLFLDHNPHNRDWQASRTEEYLESIKENEWMYNGESISFYTTGDLSNGQHRLAAIGLSDHLGIETLVGFGVPTSAYDTIDDVKKRSGGDAAGIAGVTADKGLKDAIIKAAQGFFTHVRGSAFPQGRSNRQRGRAIQKFNDKLTAAIAVGERSRENLPAALPISKAEAAKTAFVMLASEWSPDKAYNVLRRLQEGKAVPEEGGRTSPVYVGRTIIDRKRKAKELNTLAQIRVVISVARALEFGETACRAKDITDDAKNGVDPSYPPMQAETQEEEAEGINPRRAHRATQEEAGAEAFV